MSESLDRPQPDRCKPAERNFIKLMDYIGGNGRIAAKAIPGAMWWSWSSDDMPCAETFQTKIEREK